MIERELYLKQLETFKDKNIIKVITGIRRCGKSSLLKTFADRLRKAGVKNSHIIEINLEDLKYDNLDYKSLNEMIVEQLSKNTNNKTYIFLDEIQRVENWEKVANSLYLNKNADLYLTGSNAYMLSSELSTYLSGRFVEIKMLPLSFKEFLDFYTFEPNITKEEKFGLYLKFGGMPSIAEYNFDELAVSKTLDGIYNTVLMKDVVARDVVKDITSLQKLVKYLADNIGNITSINSITNVLYSEKSISSKNNKMIEEYIHYLESAFIFYKVNRYDIKGKDLLKSLEKYYIVDMGLREYLLGKITDKGRILENIVYFELLRRGYKVSIGKIGDKEVDFVATKTEQKIYIQVTETLANEATRERELSSLDAIKDNFEKIVLTTDVLFTGITDKGYKVLNIIDWLLKE